MRTARSRGGSGFTLIELIVAMLVLSVGLLALSALVHRMAGQLEDSRRITRLDLRARSALDSLLALGFGGVESGLWEQGGYEVRIEEQGPGLREVLIVMTEDAVASPRADTLATRSSAR